MKMVLCAAALAASFYLLAVPAFAHSGGLNAQGCHAGSQPYHCHRAQVTPPRVATPLLGNTSGDRDCADFRSWREAQDFFEAAGRGDPHQLDGDNDGIACESLR